MKIVFSRFHSVLFLFFDILMFEFHSHRWNVFPLFIPTPLYMSMFNVAMYTLLVSVIFAVSSILSPSFRLQLALDESAFGIRNCFVKLFQTNQIWQRCWKVCWYIRALVTSLNPYLCVNGAWEENEWRSIWDVVSCYPDQTVFHFHAIPKLTVLLKFQTYSTIYEQELNSTWERSFGIVDRRPMTSKKGRSPVFRLLHFRFSFIFFSLFVCHKKHSNRSLYFNQIMSSVFISVRWMRALVFFRG